MSKKSTNLLIDFGESSLRFVVLEETESEATIRNIYESSNSGSAPQAGNNSNTYVMHTKAILNTIDKISQIYEIDSILLNLPSIHDELVVLQEHLKRMSPEDQIRNASEFFSTDDMVLYGPPREAKDGYSIVAVSSVQKEFAKILDGIQDTYRNITMYITTSFIRLQLISDFLEIDKPHAIIDTGYSKLKAMVFDENSVPTNAFNTSLSGKDIIDLMVNDTKLGNRDYLTAIHDFNHLVGLTNDVKKYINNSLKSTKQIIKQNVLNESQIVFCGGLSTLPWAMLFSNTDYEIETLTCDAVGSKGDKALAVTTAPLLYMDITSCSVINNSDADVSDTQYDDVASQQDTQDDEENPYGIEFDDEEEKDIELTDEEEEEPYEEESYEEEPEEGSYEESYEEEPEEDPYEEEEEPAPRKSKKDKSSATKTPQKQAKSSKSIKSSKPQKSAKSSKPGKPAKPVKSTKTSTRLVSQEDEYDTDEEELLAPVKPSKKSSRQSPTDRQSRQSRQSKPSKQSKPHKPAKSNKRQPDPDEYYEDEEYLEDDYYDEDDKPKKKKGGISLTLLVAALVVAIGIGCLITVKMYLSHQTTVEQTAQNTAKSSQSLTEYVKNAVQAVGLQISTENSEVLGNMEYYYVGFDNVTKDSIQNLANKLTECNLEILNKEDLPDGNVNVTLKINFK